MQCGPDLIELHTWFTSFYFKLRFRNLWCWLLPKAGGNHPIFLNSIFFKVWFGFKVLSKKLMLRNFGACVICSCARDPLS